MSTRFRLHLENGRQRNELFHLTLEQWTQAAARHPELAKQIDVSVGWDGDILEKALQDADALLAGPIDRPKIIAAKKLKWIHTTGAGVDHLLPLDWLPEQITVTNSSGIHGDKTEDFISMALLMLHNKMPQILANQTKQIWDMIHEFNIRGKTATVIGFGDVGRAAGLGAKRLGMKVIAVTRSGAAQPLADETISVSQLDGVLPRTDYLIVAAPLTADTRGLITDARIASLPKGAGLINIGRSPIVDYAAVIKHLASKQLDGAILDVFDKEPLEPSSPLWTTPNLIVTPHISCDAPDYVQRVLDCWFANFAKLTTTGQLENKINRQLGY